MGSLNPLVAGNEWASPGEADKWFVRPGRDTVCRKTHTAPGPGSRGTNRLCCFRPWVEVRRPMGVCIVLGDWCSSPVHSHLGIPHLIEHLP